MKRLLAVGAAAVWLLAIGLACDLTNVEVDENLPPVIHSLNPEKPRAQVDDRVVFEAVISDPDSYPLGYFWDRTPKNTSELETEGRFARFTGQADRQYTIRAIVTDGDLRRYEDSFFNVVSVYQDFEGFAAGVLPAGPWNFDTGNFDIRVTDKVAVAPGNRSLEFVDYGTTSEPTAMLSIADRITPGESASDADEIVAFNVMLNGQGFVTRCYQLPDTEATGLIWEIVFDDGKIVATGPGNFKDTMANTVQQQWLEFKVLMDFDSSSWAVVINDQIAGSSLPMFTGASVCDGIEFAGTDPNDAARFFIDDIVVTRNPDFDY